MSARALHLAVAVSPGVWAGPARAPEAAANAFFTLGAFGALGYSPFSIDTLPDERAARLGAALPDFRSLSAEAFLERYENAAVIQPLHSVG